MDAESDHADEVHRPDARAERNRSQSQPAGSSLRAEQRTRRASQPQCRAEAGHQVGGDGSYGAVMEVGDGGVHDGSFLRDGAPPSRHDVDHDVAGRGRSQTCPADRNGANGAPRGVRGTGNRSIRSSHLAEFRMIQPRRAHRTYTSEETVLPLDTYAWAGLVPETSCPRGRTSAAGAERRRLARR